MANSNSCGPEYYRRGNIQVWDFIRDQGLNFHLGNAIKYICRAGYKGIDGKSMTDAYIKDLTKAIHYLQNELEQEILHQRTGKGVQGWFPSDEQYDASFTDYAADFDR
jgi:hypothetical protein